MMKMYQVALAVVGLMTTASVQAHSWRLVGDLKKSGFNFFVDRDSVRRSGDVVNFAIMTVLDGKNTNFDWVYSVTIRDARCVALASSMTDQLYYDKDGVLIEHVEHVTPMTVHPEGSNMEGAIQMACGNLAYNSAIISDPVTFIRGGKPTTSSSETVASRNRAATVAGATVPATGRGGEAQLSPLRPTAALEAHNPANEASDCLEPISADAYDARSVKSITGAVFRNTCAYPVEARWCVGADRCAKGYDNLATMPAKADRSISYDPPSNGTRPTIHWAGCRNGFANRPDFNGSLQYACK